MLAHPCKTRYILNVIYPDHGGWGGRRGCVVPNEEFYMHFFKCTCTYMLIRGAFDANSCGIQSLQMGAGLGPGS